MGTISQILQGLHEMYANVIAEVAQTSSLSCNDIEYKDQNCRAKQYNASFTHWLARDILESCEIVVFELNS